MEGGKGRKLRIYDEGKEKRNEKGGGRIEEVGVEGRRGKKEAKGL